MQRLNSTPITPSSTPKIRISQYRPRGNCAISGRWNTGSSPNRDDETKSDATDAAIVARRISVEKFL